MTSFDNHSARGMRARVDRAFDRWGRLVFRFRWAALALSLLVTGLAFSALPGLRYDNSTESLLIQNDPALALYKRFQDEFGQDQFIVVSAEGRNIFDLEFLEKLRALHEDLEREVPYVEEVTSLVNVRDTRSEGDTLVVGGLLDDWPQTAGELAQIRERAIQNRFYENSLFNKAETLTGVVLKPQMYTARSSEQEVLGGFEAGPPAQSASPQPLTYEEQIEQIVSIRKVVEAHSEPGFTLRLSGAQPVNQHLNDILSQEAAFSIGGSLLVNLLLLLVLFRRVSSVLVAGATVLSATITAFGVMVLLDIPMSVTNSILARFLVVVGLCNAVHLLTSVYQVSTEVTDKEQVIGDVLRRTGPPVAMASLTTAGGVFAFIGTDLAQTINLGISASIGVVLALVYSLVMLPAAASLAPLSKKGAFGGGALERIAGDLLGRAGRTASAHPARVLVLAALVVGLGGAGLQNLRFAQDPMDWFPQRDPMRESTQFLDRELAGVLSLEVLVDTGRENGLKTPEWLNRLDGAMQYAESLSWVGKATSIVDVVKETHQSLNGDDLAYYAIPDDSQVIAQELLLFENGGSGEIEDFTDPSFQVARLTLRQPYSDGMLVEPRVAELRGGLERELGPEATIEVTGVTSLFGRTFKLLNFGLAQSYLGALLIITPLMILMVGSFRLGLVAMIPNIAPILLTLGIMGWTDLPLDNSTLLLGCVILGIAVDDTIHLMHGFRDNIATGADVESAVQRTLRKTGLALLTTTVVLTLGFLVGTASYLNNIVRFGALASFTTLTAFIADIYVLPALLAVFARREVADLAELDPDPAAAR